jgi:HlyD family secretion protein
MRRFAWLLLVIGSAAGAETLRLEGELFARSKSELTPPTIDNMWNLNISQLAPDGSMVKAGDPVVGFDGGELQKQLMARMSALDEKRRERDKLLLELAERERAERLQTEERRAAQDKARRKATQPEDLLRRVDYQKLVAEREHAEQALRLAERRETLAAEQRRQEQRLVEAEVRQLQTQVDTLTASIAALRVTAPRDGQVQHRSDNQGNKLDVGSQVWRGQAIAEIPDPASIAVRATLPEHQFTRLGEGAVTRVIVEGSGATLSGRVLEIGRVVRSKSRLQPVPVVDVLIGIDALPAGLKPGQTVRVEVDVADIASTAP